MTQKLFGHFLEPPFTLFGKKLEGVPPSPVDQDGIKFVSANNRWELAPFGGGGENNTSSNVGNGAGLALPKVGVDLPFKSLVANTEVLIGTNPTEILFSIGLIAQSKIIGLVTALGTKIDTIVNVGAGVGKVFRDKVGTTMNLKSLLAGTGILITNNADTIEISATDPASKAMIGCNYDTDATGGFEFYTLCGGGITGSPTENERQLILPLAITASNLSIKISATGTTTVKYRRGGASQNQTITTSLTGVFTDAVNTDPEPALTLVNISVNEDVGATIIDSASILMRVT